MPANRITKEQTYIVLLTTFDTPTCDILKHTESYFRTVYMRAYFSSLPARVSRSSSKTDARRFSVRARCITFLLKTSLPSNDEENDETDKKRKKRERKYYSSC